MFHPNQLSTEVITFTRNLCAWLDMMPADELEGFAQELDGAKKRAEGGADVVLAAFAGCARMRIADRAGLTGPSIACQHPRTTEVRDGRGICCLDCGATGLLAS